MQRDGGIAAPTRRARITLWHVQPFQGRSHYRCQARVPGRTLPRSRPATATATCIALCRPLFLDHSNVIFGCDMKKHCFIPRFRYGVVASTDHIHHSAAHEKQVESADARPASNRYFSDWISVPHSSLRSGMFKHPNVVRISAAKRASQEEPLPAQPPRNGHAHARSHYAGTG